jgi:multidrug efflux pump subunit AcrA (membrane-fusion protein)
MESEMVKIVVEVAQSDNPTFDDDKMVIVMEVDVADRETARALLRQAEADERSIVHLGQMIEEGEVWISIEDGEIEDPCPCFHRADAVDALEMYLGIAPGISKKALAKANVNRLYRQIQAENAREAREGADATHEE